MASPTLALALRFNLRELPDSKSERRHLYREHASPSSDYRDENGDWFHYRPLRINKKPPAASIKRRRKVPA